MHYFDLYTALVLQLLKNTSMSSVNYTYYNRVSSLIHKRTADLRLCDLRVKNGATRRHLHIQHILNRVMASFRTDFNDSSGQINRSHRSTL